MPLIILETMIAAPIEVCWALALSPEVHTSSMAHTEERIVTGRTQGAFELNDVVTWEAKHFSIRQRLTVCITAICFPEHFRDEMVHGIFKVMRHDHFFYETERLTRMRDEFYYEAPWGLLGRIADVLFLRRYMRKLLQRRNAAIKSLAESGGGKDAFVGILSA